MYASTIRLGWGVSKIDGVSWRCCWACILHLLIVTTRHPAQEVERLFCEEEKHCTDDRLEIVFPGRDGAYTSTYRYEEFVPGTRMDTQVHLEVVNERMQGWAAAVKHDTKVLTLIEDSVGLTETMRSAMIPPFLEVTKAVDGGYITANVLTVEGGPRLELPPGRYPLCNASYRLAADAGSKGSRIEFADKEIGPEGSPPVELGLTIDGYFKRPRKLVEGLVVRGDVAFRRADADGNGKLTISDAVFTLATLFGTIDASPSCEKALDANDDSAINLSDAVWTLNYLFKRGPHPPGPFPSCAVDPTPDALDCELYLACN